MINKKAFNEEFVKRVIETKDQQFFKDNNLTINEIKSGA